MEEIAVLLPGVLDAAGVRWVDAPWLLHRARLKPVQLAIAAGLGIRVPRTLVTGDAVEAKEFACDAAPLAKAASAGRGVAPYVAAVPDDQLSLVETCPTTLQECVDAVADMRIVTVGGEAFGWRRSRSEGDPIDWRAADRDGTAFVSCGEGPLAEAVMLAAAFDLSFSVQDWLETANESVFLEINPQGQWLFLAQAEQLLVPAVVDHLLAGHV
jgi:glutathione synthase/RimK-type ligase-like ATP-grasp enzyme